MFVRCAFCWTMIVLIDSLQNCTVAVGWVQHDTRQQQNWQQNAKPTTSAFSAVLSVLSVSRNKQYHYLRCRCYWINLYFIYNCRSAWEYRSIWILTENSDHIYFSDRILSIEYWTVTVLLNRILKGKEGTRKNLGRLIFFFLFWVIIGMLALYTFTLPM